MTVSHAHLMISFSKKMIANPNDVSFLKQINSQSKWLSLTVRMSLLSHTPCTRPILLTSGLVLLPYHPPVDVLITLVMIRAGPRLWKSEDELTGRHIRLRALYHVLWTQNFVVYVRSTRYEPINRCFSTCVRLVLARYRIDERCCRFSTCTRLTLDTWTQTNGVRSLLVLCLHSPHSTCVCTRLWL